MCLNASNWTLRNIISHFLLTSIMEKARRPVSWSCLLNPFVQRAALQLRCLKWRRMQLVNQKLKLCWSYLSWPTKPCCLVVTHVDIPALRIMISSKSTHNDSNLKSQFLAKRTLRTSTFISLF